MSCVEDFASLTTRFLPATIALLAAHGQHAESVLFSHAVSKFNRRSVSQRRLLLLTTHALYNLKQSRVSLPRYELVKHHVHGLR